MPMEPWKRGTRVQTGVAQWSDDDQWYVVQRHTLPGQSPEMTMYGPPYPTEAEANEACARFIREFRANAVAAGFTIVPTAGTN